MSRYLVTFNDDYVNGFRVMTEKEIGNFEGLALSITWDFTIDNVLSYQNGEDFFSRFDFREITKQEYDTLEKIFDGQYGSFYGPETLKKILSEDDDSEEDEDEDEDF